MMNKKDIEQQMVNILSESAESPIDEQQEDLNWIGDLPPKQEHELYLYLNYGNTWDKNRIIVCLKELSWIEINRIECSSYRKSSKSQNLYYSGENERKEILLLAISWVADVKSKECKYNTNGSILSQLPEDLIGLVWDAYMPFVKLSAKEADNIYNAALVYYGIKSDPEIIYPAIVVEVDLLIQLGTLSLKEIREIRSTDLERMKLVLKARSEALLLKNVDEQPQKIEAGADLLSKYPAEMFPPGIRR